MKSPILSLRALVVLLCLTTVTPATQAKPEAITARGPLLGSAHAVVVTGGSFRWGWAVGCQDRQETDARGSLIGASTTEVGEHASLYLWTVDGKETMLDVFLGQSPSGRFLAYLKREHLVVFDTQTNKETDLSELGANVLAELDDTWPPPSVAFSYGHWVAFLRTNAGLSEVVALDLESGIQRVLYETHAVVRRFRFDAEGKELLVFELPADTGAPAKPKQVRIVPTRDKHHCNWGAFAYGRQALAVEERSVLRVPIHALADTEVREETLAYAVGCIADGRRALRQSSRGGFIVSPPEQGPLQWISSPIPPDQRYCVKELTDVPIEHQQPSRRQERLSLATGFNMVLGLRHFELDAMNQSFKARRFSTTGTNHSVLALEFPFDIGRMRFALRGGGLVSDSVRRSRAPQGEARILGMVGELLVGYRALRTERVSLYPEIGLKWVATDVYFDAGAPPLDVGGFAFHDSPRMRATSLLMGTAVRLEARAITLNSDTSSGAYLTFGTSLGWEKQLSSGGWTAYDDEDELGHHPGPAVNLSGPTFLMHVGFTSVIRR